MIRDATLPLERSVARYSAVRDYLVAALAQIRCWYIKHRPTFSAAVIEPVWVTGRLTVRCATTELDNAGLYPDRY